MIDAFVRSLLGTWGNAVLDFYLSNHFWINAFVLSYALLIFLGRTSYHRSAKFLLDWLEKKFAADAKAKSRSGLVKLIEKEEIPWGPAGASFWFPLITPPGRFLPSLKNEHTLQKMFSKDALVAILYPAKEPKGKSKTGRSP
ncbi:MAG: hypothetical protein FJZ87_15515 [Chloroflexi bacterium]|nr:hypothetical protein [Chloroflexota bacterium]